MRKFNINIFLKNIITVIGESENGMTVYEIASHKIFENLIDDENRSFTFRNLQRDISGNLISYMKQPDSIVKFRNDMSRSKKKGFSVKVFYTIDNPDKIVTSEKTKRMINRCEPEMPKSLIDEQRRIIEEMKKHWV